MPSSTTGTTTTAEPTRTATVKTLTTQKFGGKSRSSGRVRCCVHGEVPKHVGDTHRERHKQGKMGGELKGDKPNGHVRPSSLHSSSDGQNPRGYRGKVLLLAQKMKQHSKALYKYGNPLLLSSIRRSPSGEERGNRRKSINQTQSQLLLWAPLQSGINEMEQIREILERHLEKHLLEKQQGGDNSVSHSSSPPSSNHCHLFTSCMLLLRGLQSDQCHSLPAEFGRPVPGLPRRRFGRCNARLLPLFERVDSARAQLEHGTEQCLEENVRNGTARAKGSCPSELSYLLPPTMSTHSECSEHVALLHQHCKKLGRCCKTLESCQNRIGTSGLARRVKLEEQKLAIRSTKCQMQAQEIFRIFKEKQRTEEELLKAKKRRNMMT